MTRRASNMYKYCHNNSLLRLAYRAVPDLLLRNPARAGFVKQIQPEPDFRISPYN